ncbi:ATP-binding protein [Aquisphaera insulae]|uniref:ATP-binding protein n=1 Tax=Aquisphaera insulae TaxID=2712864 RepID=UPI0013EDCD21|nr:ATP-binding protein [Aquisphaera insulae]
MPAIKLSSKTLVHISSGLYRSTANALKELISNAFDADATLVEINTNSPRFDTLTCKDNGTGMSKTEFERLMEGGIGNSRKRVGMADDNEVTATGRPLIGRIGIGLLAIAQVCYQFKISSHHRETRTAFEAVVNLRPYRRDELASADTEKNIDLEVGQYTCKEIRYDESAAGVFLSTKDMHPSYTQRYSDDVVREAFQLVPMRFSSFLSEVLSKRSIRELGDYWQLLWELCISCPVSYVDEGPLRADYIIASSEHDSKTQVVASATEAIGIAGKLSAALTGYNFTVKLDGTPIRKPALLPHKESLQLESRAFPIEFDGKIEGSRLKYDGYIYLQTRMIKPAELRGILVRVRNVAIGDYDLTCLNYEKVQGFRRDWLSGEVFVEHGLEDALNIDRHSFNEVHPHFMAMQRHIHKLLNEDVFPSALRASTLSGRRKSESTRTTGDSALTESIKAVVNMRYTVSRDGKKTSEPVPINIDEKKHRIVIHEHPLWPKNRTARIAAERIAVAFMLARLHAEDSESIAEIAFQILGGSTAS